MAIKNDSNGHQYCDAHFAGEGKLCRAVEDIKKSDTKLEISQNNLHQRIDDVEVRIAQKIDASDQSDSIKHKEIYDVIREMEKGKMAIKTFWSILGLLMILSGGAIGYTNVQLRDTRKDQMAIAEKHTTQMKVNAAELSGKIENFTFKLGGKLDDLKDDVRDLKAEIKIVQNDLTHVNNEIAEHKAEHKAEHMRK